MRKKMKIIRKWEKVGKFVIHLLPIKLQRGVTINVFNILYIYIYIKYFCINYIKYPEAK